MVKTGQIAIYYGAGKGKTSVSLGKGIRALGENLRVVMIQFMDYHNNQEIALLEKLEPDFRIFHFEKDREGTEMTEEIRKEIASEIRNAFNFTKKILDTGECDMLMLDGILECVEEGYLLEEEVVEMMGKTSQYHGYDLDRYQSASIHCPESRPHFPNCNRKINPIFNKKDCVKHSLFLYVYARTSFMEYRPAGCSARNFAAFTAPTANTSLLEA